MHWFLSVLVLYCLWQRFSTALASEKNIHAFSYVKRSPEFVLLLLSQCLVYFKHFSPLKFSRSSTVVLDLFRALKNTNCRGLSVNLSKMNTHFVHYK